MTRKNIHIILFVAFALAAAALCTGCGGGQAKSNSQDQEKAEAAAEYAGVLKEVYGDAFEMANDAGEWEFRIDENTEFAFGDYRHMYAGDTIRVECADAESTVAEKITILEKGDPVTNLGDFAAGLCWPYGESNKGRYDTGSKTEAYAALYDRIKPQDQSTFSTGTQWRAGASCDLFVATALQGFGLTGFPVALAEQCDYFFINEQYQDDFEKIETGGDPAKMQHGDVCVYISAGSENNGQGHIFVVNKSSGMNLRSNGHYRKDKGYYGVTDEMKDHYDPGHYKYFGVFRIK